WVADFFDGVRHTMEREKTTIMGSACGITPVTRLPSGDPGIITDEEVAFGTAALCFPTDRRIEDYVLRVDTESDLAVVEQWFRASEIVLGPLAEKETEQAR